jgi:DNA-binding LacI/PurR family transcriptional regulator
MSSIKDVAKKAGVSVSAVSKVFNGYTDVSEKTKEKVMATAKELNYFPNIVAKNLSQKQTKTIALILSNFDEGCGPDGIIFKILSGILNACVDNEYELLIFTTTQSQQQKKSYYQLCTERKVAGVIIFGLKTTDRYFKEIVESRIHSVVIDADTVGKNTSSISIDNVQAAKDGVNYLMKKGHRKIGFINGHRNAVVSMQREEGYAYALREANIEINADLVCEGDFEEDKAYLLAEEYLKKNKDVTAVFCASDLMAIGFMRRCQELGINVPEQISILGFDDIDLSKYVTPTLSTVRQEFYSMGYEATKLLIHSIKTGQFGEHKNLSQKIVDRNSVKDL